MHDVHVAAMAVRGMLARTRVLRASLRKACAGAFRFQLGRAAVHADALLVCLARRRDLPHVAYCPVSVVVAGTRKKVRVHLC